MKGKRPPYNRRKSDMVKDDHVNGDAPHIGCGNIPPQLFGKRKGDKAVRLKAALVVAAIGLLTDVDLWEALRDAFIRFLRSVI